DIFNYNDEQDENSELAKSLGIKGSTYEILYMDEDSNIRFDAIERHECILVYDTTVECNPNFAIRYYTEKSLGEGQDITYIEVYTKEKILYYKKENEDLELTETKEHYWGDVPIVEYPNNDERLGDFEPVISLIDAYDKAQSDTLNDLEYFSDAYM